MKLAAAALLVFGTMAGAGESSARAADPVVVRAFVTDGCTYWPEGTRGEPNLWHHCCVDHDLALWAGGTHPERLATDLRLRDCVAATGQPEQAEIVYLGVRIGAMYPIKNGMQWGNAWSQHETRRTKLKPEEIDLLEAEIFRPVYDSVATIEQRRALIERLRSEK